MGGVYTESDILPINDPRLPKDIITGVKIMKQREDGTEFDEGMRDLRALRGKIYAGVTKDNKKCRHDDDSLRKNAPIGCEITAAEAEEAFKRHYHRKYFGSSKKAKDIRKKVAEKVDKTVY